MGGSILFSLCSLRFLCSIILSSHFQGVATTLQMFIFVVVSMESTPSRVLGGHCDGAIALYMFLVLPCICCCIDLRWRWIVYFQPNPSSSQHHCYGVQETTNEHH